MGYAQKGAKGWTVWTKGMIMAVEQPSARRPSCSELCTGTSAVASLSRSAVRSQGPQLETQGLVCPRRGTRCQPGPWDSRQNLHVLVRPQLSWTLWNWREGLHLALTLSDAASGGESRCRACGRCRRSAPCRMRRKTCPPPCGNIPPVWAAGSQTTQAQRMYLNSQSVQMSREIKQRLCRLCASAPHRYL